MFFFFSGLVGDGFYAFVPADDAICESLRPLGYCICKRLIDRLPNLGCLGHVLSGLDYTYMHMRYFP